MLSYNELKLYTDGGARGNPGPAGIGVVLTDEAEKKVAEYGEYIGETTNNVAEYKALISGMTRAGELGAKKLACHLDSELIVKQLNGKYKIKNEGLKPLAAEVLKLTNKFLAVNFTHVPREKNHQADALVNKALDAHKKAGKLS